jgi:hypothetical protein
MAVGDQESMVSTAKLRYPGRRALTPPIQEFDKQIDSVPGIMAPLQYQPYKIAARKPDVIAG